MRYNEPELEIIEIENVNTLVESGTIDNSGTITEPDVDLFG